MWILCFGKETPTDESWEYFMNELRSFTDTTKIRILCRTYGGHANGKQRADLTKHVGSGQLKSAIITDSIIVRGVATALTWFLPDVAAFHPKDIDKACEYLGLSPKEIEIGKSELAKLARELGMR